MRNGVTPELRIKLRNKRLTAASSGGSTTGRTGGATSASATGGAR